jgi:hypothetical protein
VIYAPRVIIESDFVLNSFFPMEYRLLSDMSRFESKVERLEAQVATKERELAALTRTVWFAYLCKFAEKQYTCFSSCLL